MSDEPKPEKPAATPEAIDPKEVRAQLGLPENAPDADVIAGLLAVIAGSPNGRRVSLLGSGRV